MRITLPPLRYSGKKKNSMSRRIKDEPLPRRSCRFRSRRLAFALRLALTPLLALPLSASAQSGIEDIGTLGGMYSVAIGVSVDGLVVVGSVFSADLSVIRPFRWTSGGGMVGLGTLGGMSSDVAGVSADLQRSEAGRL